MVHLWLYPVLAAAAYFLGARATLTRPLWSRYPKWLDGFMNCPACSGTWYGFGLAAVGYWQDWDFAGLSAHEPMTWLVIGAYCMVTVPLVAVVHTYAMLYLQDSPGVTDMPSTPPPTQEPPPLPPLPPVPPLDLDLPLPAPKEDS